MARLTVEKYKKPDNTPPDQMLVSFKKNQKFKNHYGSKSSTILEHFHDRIT